MTSLGFEHRWLPGESRYTLLALHGTGGNEDDLVPLARELAPHANVLSPRGQVLEQGMPRFFRRLAMGVFDEDDVVRRAKDLAEFVAAASAAHGFSATDVWAVGYSNGANIAAALLLLHPASLAGAVLLRPVLPIVPRTPPDLSGREVRIAAGESDPYSPRERVTALEDRLKAAGARVDLSWKHAGHELLPEELDEAKTWLAERIR
jgi:phospholipase/carboxylesterase